MASTLIGEVMWVTSGSAGYRPALVCDPRAHAPLAGDCCATKALCRFYGDEPYYEVCDIQRLLPYLVGVAAREGTRDTRQMKAAVAARPPTTTGEIVAAAAAGRRAKPAYKPGQQRRAKRAAAVSIALTAAEELPAPRRKRQRPPPASGFSARRSGGLRGRPRPRPRRRSPREEVRGGEEGAVEGAGAWPDGKAFGRGHGQPYLQPKRGPHQERRQDLGGRAYAGWLEHVSVDDCITFKVTTRGASSRSASGADTFEDMLDHCGLDACLPGCASREEGAKIYRSFGCFDGRTYADVEAEAGVVAIRVMPLDHIN
ncbi:hypothetical protein JL721_11269 [Aureococcus anophagefferens]|nr:hypothetical protein JL721_11269 [Aureococcus anophagefferens]